tara:strand:+ start:992 stop:1471 length:480 start_codon:yes stop_codon:yes gene_type:complete
MRKPILAILLILFSATLFSQSKSYTEQKSKKLQEKSPFEKIWDGELPAEVVYKDDQIIAFVPLTKQAPIHFLIVPKKRIATINDLDESDTQLIGKMFLVAKDLAKKYDISETGFRLVINTNEDSGQSVFHLHLHLLGGIKTGPMVDQTFKNANGKKEGN